MLCCLETFVLRFPILPYYRRAAIYTDTKTRSTSLTFLEFKCLLNKVYLVLSLKNILLRFGLSKEVLLGHKKISHKIAKKYWPIISKRLVDITIKK